jgi:hypothetical protein
MKRKTNIQKKNFNKSKLLCVKMNTTDKNPREDRLRKKSREK